MDKQQTLKAACRTLGLTHTRETLEKILHDAEKEGWSYLDFLVFVTDSEILFKQEKAKNKRIKEAGFPYPKYLKDFDLGFCQALSKRQFKQLSELTWIDGLYNLILSGPPGVGKTHLAIALGYQACEDGYKVSYTTMKSLIKVLRTEEIDRRKETFSSSSFQNSRKRHLSSSQRTKGLKSGPNSSETPRWRPRYWTDCLSSATRSR